MSNVERRGVKYTIDDGRWVTDDNVPSNVETVDQFMRYLGTLGVSLPSSPSITMNLQTVNSNATLAATNGGRDEDNGYVFLAFMQDNKTGGDMR